MTNATCLVDTCDKPSKTRGMCGMHAERVRVHGTTDRPSLASAPLADRFWAKARRSSDDDCWNWTAMVAGGGYGQFSVNGKKVPAHRVAYQLEVGAVPDGLVLDHLCRNRLCVNPRHLEPVSNRENILRGEGLAAVHAAKEQCVRGHEFDRTIIQYGRERRICTTCVRERGRKRVS